MTRRITVRSGSIPRKVAPPASEASAAGADTDAIHDNVDGEIILIAEKASPVGADVLLIEDSAASNAKKRVSITNLPGGADADAIHDNVASEISAITSKATPIDTDFLLIEDSADGDAKKKITVGDLPVSEIELGELTDVGVDGGPGSAEKVLTYATDVYDGVFDYLGKDYDTAGWAHPETSRGYIVTSQINDQDGTRTSDKGVDQVVTSPTNESHTQNTPSAWWKTDFDAEPGNTFAPTHVVLFGRSTGGLHPRNWKIQGSNNDSTWDDLLTIVNNGPSDGTTFDAAIIGASAYRYLRVFQYGVNSGGSNYLIIGDIEFWGSLFYTEVRVAQDGDLIEYRAATDKWVATSKGVIQVKTDTGDPVDPVEGQMVANTFDNNVKIYADGAWRSLATW